MEKSKPKYVLQEAIGSTLEDLDLNRDGQMSGTQIGRLKYKRNRCLLLNALLTVVIVLAVRDLSSTERDDVGRSIFLMLLAGLPFAWSLLRWVQYTLDLWRGAVEVVEGGIQLDVVNQGKGGIGYKVCCQERCFDVAKPVFLAFKNYEPYLIFYAPYSKTILSAEWLRE